MPCPTCDHTMHAIETSPHKLQYLCPRCGTLLTRIVTQTCGGQPTEFRDEVAVPKLVERCRKYAEKVLAATDVPGHDYRRDEWRRLGIAESINVPADRPKA